MTGERAAGEADVVEPGAAFHLLADGTRARIVQELGAAWSADWPGVVGYADLMDRVGAADSGRFNYHLSQLVDRYVSHKTEGYKLDYHGLRVYRAIVAGTFTDDVTIDASRSTPTASAAGRAWRHRTRTPSRPSGVRTAGRATASTRARHEGRPSGRAPTCSSPPTVECATSSRCSSTASARGVGPFPTPPRTDRRQRPRVLGGDRLRPPRRPPVRRLRRPPRPQRRPPRPPPSRRRLVFPRERRRPVLDTVLGPGVRSHQQPHDSPPD